MGGGDLHGLKNVRSVYGVLVWLWRLGFCGGLPAYLHSKSTPSGWGRAGAGAPKPHIPKPHIPYSEFLRCFLTAAKRMLLHRRNTV